MGMKKLKRQVTGWVRWFRRYPVISIFFIALFLLMAVFANLIAPHSPYQTSLPARFLPPFWMEGGSLNHILGTDALGRDLFSRLLIGARVSILVAFISLLVGGAIGTIIGITAGYFSGLVDSILMRLADAVLGFPLILLAILLAITRGASFETLIFAVCIVLWARYARVIRSETLSLKERDFVALAKVAGRSPLWIMFHHIFPNVVNTLVVVLTLQVGWVILVEATLSYLGAGVPSPYPAWGTMVSDGRAYLDSAWWVSLFPGLMILLIALSFNLFGDWLRKALDPKLRQVSKRA